MKRGLKGNREQDQATQNHSREKIVPDEEGTSSPLFIGDGPSAAAPRGVRAP